MGFTHPKSNETSMVSTRMAGRNPPPHECITLLSVDPMAVNDITLMMLRLQRINIVAIEAAVFAPRVSASTKEPRGGLVSLLIRPRSILTTSAHPAAYIGGYWRARRVEMSAKGTMNKGARRKRRFRSSFSSVGGIFSLEE